MGILSPPRRTTITGATFSRNSEAYDSLGRIALPGLPRLEYVTGVGWVTWVEEAATNLLTANQANIEIDLFGINPNVGSALERDITEAKYGGASLKVVTPGSVTQEGFYLATNNVTANNTYTFSLWIKGNGTIQIGIYERTSSSVYVGATFSSAITLTNTWEKYSISRAFGGTGEKAAPIVITNSAQAITFYADGLQLEQKAYPTSFCLPGSPRTAESLTMPTAGLSVSEGTIEGIFEVTDVSKRQDGATFFRLFNIINGTGAGISIYHLATSAYWQLKTYTSGVVTSTVDIADSLTPNGFYYYKVSWTASEAAAEFWNLESQTKVALETISSPNLPTAFGSYVYLGSYNGSINYLDTRFGKHRLSNIARTDDPDFNDLMSDDANTVGIFDPTPIYNQNVR